MTSKHVSVSVTALLLAAAAIGGARAQQGSSDAAYIAKAMSAAPAAIAHRGALDRALLVTG